MFRDALLSRGSHLPASGNQQQQAQDTKKSAKKTGKPTGSRALRPYARPDLPRPQVRAQGHTDQGSGRCRLRQSRSLPGRTMRALIEDHWSRRRFSNG